MNRGNAAYQISLPVWKLLCSRVKCDTFGDIIGRRGGIRTLKPVRAADFKSAVYAIPPLAR